jgi:ssDNA thymidine ADP-ribosyltransferase, DarT
VTRPPPRPAIYHITHVDNLPAILRDGRLFSDVAMLQRGGPPQSIGMRSIKRRRVEEIEVSCHAPSKVGEYVPFNLCARSVMLYLLHKGNHENLTYHGGQGPILHLEADLHEVVGVAEAADQRWAIALSNAGARGVACRTGLDALHELDWSAIQATDFRDASVRHYKMAEFLVHDSFMFALVRRIGVQSSPMKAKVEAILRSTSYAPSVEVRADWYY